MKFTHLGVSLPAASAADLLRTSWLSAILAVPFSAAASYTPVLGLRTNSITSSAADSAAIPPAFLAVVSVATSAIEPPDGTVAGTFFGAGRRGTFGGGSLLAAISAPSSTTSATALVSAFLAAVSAAAFVASSAISSVPFLKILSLIAFTPSPSLESLSEIYL